MNTASTPEAARRRFGFVALLFWVGFTFGAFDTVRNHIWTLFRIIYLPVVFLLAVFMSYAWWTLKKGSDKQS
jgi:membrane protein DedA with SNARE-associated domain